MHFYAEYSGHVEIDKCYSRINTVQINKVLTKHVKNVHGEHPIIILISTFKNPNITITNFDKYFMPNSHLVIVRFSDSGHAEYFELYVLPTYNLEIIAYLQRHLISSKLNYTNYRV